MELTSERDSICCVCCNELRTCLSDSCEERLQIFFGEPKPIECEPKPDTSIRSKRVLDGQLIKILHDPWREHIRYELELWVPGRNNGCWAIPEDGSNTRSNRRSQRLVC